MNAYIHPKALVETERVGAETKIWAFAHIMPDVVIGENCNIGDGVFIESGVVIGSGVTIKNNSLIWKGVHIDNYAFIGPNVVFTNDLRPRSPRMPIMKDMDFGEADWLAETRVGVGASIGANSTVIAGIELGDYCMIGAGSVVTKNVAPYHLVFGNPAVVHGVVDKYGRRVSNS